MYEMKCNRSWNTGATCVRKMKQYPLYLPEHQIEISSEPQPVLSGIFGTSSPFAGRSSELQPH